MPDWLHRTNKTRLRSVAPADLPEPAVNYIENPDLTAVTGWPPIYWDIAGDVVALMNQAERDAVDAALAAQALSDNRTEAIAAPDNTVGATIAGVQLRELFEVFNKRDNYLVNRIAELQSALLALQASNGNAGSRLDGLPASYLATNTRTRAQAIQDYKDDINAGGADT